MNLAFGRYLPYNSPIHRLDPRVKLFSLLLVIIAVFLNTGFTGYALIFVTIMGWFLLSKLPLKLLFKLMKPITFMFVIIFVINIFVIKNSDPNVDTIGVLWHWKAITISWRGILSTLYIAARIYLIILVTTILTSTTQPMDLTLAIEDLLTPFKLIKLPVHILSMIISIALRSIPTLLEEANRIMKAQASRGVDFKNGNVKDKTKAIVSLIVPLIVSAFKRAEDLAYAMDARGYDPYGKRTRFRQYHLRFFDIAMLVVMMSIFIFLCCYAGIHWFQPYHIPFIDQYAHY